MIGLNSAVSRDLVRLSSEDEDTMVGFIEAYIGDQGEAFSRSTIYLRSTLIDYRIEQTKFFQRQMKVSPAKFIAISDNNVVWGYHPSHSTQFDS